MASKESYPAVKVSMALRESNGLVSIAAKQLRCTPRTIYNYIKKYPIVAEALKTARESMVDTAESSLFNAVKNGDPWAVQFYLKTQVRNRGYNERFDIYIIKEQAKKIADEYGITVEEVLAEAEEILKETTNASA